MGKFRTVKHGFVAGVEELLRRVGLRARPVRAVMLPRTRRPRFRADTRSDYRDYLAMAISAAIMAGVVVAAIPNRAVPTKEPATRAGAAPSPAKETNERPPSVLAPIAADQFALAPPHEVVDAVTLRFGENTVRIANVLGPDAQAVCIGEDKELWACGLRGRAFMHYLVRDKEVQCTPAGPRDGNLIAAHCRTADQDIAAALIAEGWARPSTAGGAYDVQAREAADAKRGIWRGGWQIMSRL